MRENIYRAQTHECGNWACGRAIPFLGIFVSNFWYWFFAVQLTPTQSREHWIIFILYPHLRSFVLVTGASRGYGRALAIQLAKVRGF
jgi:NADPH:quinone reductase-like Zn-dependent oxidoreductase